MKCMKVQAEETGRKVHPFWPAVGVGALLLVLYLLRSQVRPALAWLEVTVEQVGPYGPAVFLLAASIWAALLLPGPLILALAGTAFAERPLVGVATVSLGFAVTQGVTFLLTRTLLRERVLQAVGHKAWFIWLDEQVQKRGAVGVLVIRTIPVFPNSLANYGFGLTNIGFWPYLFASWLGTIPIISVYVFGTSGFVNLLMSG